jgi:hypothetical protein
MILLCRKSARTGPLRIAPPPGATITATCRRTGLPPLFQLGRVRARALWGLSGWRGNERIADSIKKGPPGARAGGGCCSGSDRAPNFQGSAGRERNPVRGLAQLASLWLIACPASKLRHTCSDHCCRMGADCRELDGPLRPTARLSAIGTFARSTRARQANRFAERPEFLRPVRARQGLG